MFRRYVPLLAYLAGFVALLLLTLHFYIEPATKAASHATVTERRVLAVQSRLLLAVVLFILLVLLVMTFRAGRSLGLGTATKRKPTVYPDAWAEAARRMKPPPDS